MVEKKDSLSYIFSCITQSKLWVELGWLNLLWSSQTKGLEKKIGGLFLDAPLPLVCDKIFWETIGIVYFVMVASKGWVSHCFNCHIIMQMHNYNCFQLTFLNSAHSPAIIVASWVQSIIRQLKFRAHVFLFVWSLSLQVSIATHTPY